MRQPFTRIPKSDAMPIVLAGHLSWPAIPHHHMQKISHPCGRCLHQPFVLAMRNTVPDCILHNGLKQKTRDQAVQRPRVHIHLNPQSIRKTNLFDSQVVLH